MRFRPSSGYGVMGPDGLEEGVYVLGDSLYQYMYTGDLFLRAAPGYDYSDKQSAGEMPKVEDASQKAQVIARLKSSGRRLSDKSEIASERSRISGLPSTSVAPVGFDADTNPAPKKMYEEPWFWVSAVGGASLLGYIGYTIYKARK